jgi:hypothetical protein
LILLEARAFNASITVFIKLEFESNAFSAFLLDVSIPNDNVTLSVFVFVVDDPLTKYYLVHMWNIIEH